MPAVPSSAARHGSRPRKANRPSARHDEKRGARRHEEAAEAQRLALVGGKSVKRSDRASGTSGPDRTSLIAPPSVRSVFYRHRVERAPEVPGGDRAPRTPALAQLLHPARGDLSALEVGRRGCPSAGRGRRAGTRRARSRLNIRNISAVQRPMPRTSVSSAMISSSAMRGQSRAWILPSTKCCARSAMYSVLRSDRPQARSSVLFRRRTTVSGRDRRRNRQRPGSTRSAPP